MCTILPRGYEMDTGGRILYTEPRLDPPVVAGCTDEGKPVGVCVDHSFCGRCKRQLPFSSPHPMNYEWEKLNYCWYCNNQEQYVWVQMMPLLRDVEGDSERK